ncbi:MAG: WD40 repeat domain-containing protein [Candidatus Limnocylindria bacterium]
MPDASGIARSTAAVLLQLSAYDYALAGSLAGQMSRVVSPARWATVARGLLPRITDVTSASLSAAANAAGPVRDAVVSLADSLTDLAKDAGTYADSGDTGVFAKTTGDVGTSWDRLRALAAKLPADADLRNTIARGSSFVVRSSSEALFALQAGPYATAADADAAAKKIGTVISVTHVAPFVVRVEVYPSKLQADAAATALRPKGIDVTSIIEERKYTFARSGASPDAELWREPVRVFPGPGGARRVALSPDGNWVAMASDDGFVAIFNAKDGALLALPKFPSGISTLLFSGDSAWLFAGGAFATVLFVPGGHSPLAIKDQMRFPSAITQAVYVGIPSGRAFVAMSKSASGVAGSGAGLIGARAPDGAVLGRPFPITTPAAGGYIAASDRGELFIATTSAGNTDVEVLRLGTDRATRLVIRIPGVVQDLALDSGGDRAAVVTDQGTFRFAPHSSDPTASLRKVGATVREVAFGPDGTFYQLSKDKVVATGPDGTRRWQAPLTDGRKLVVGVRTLVWDGVDTVWAIAADGTTDALGIDGQIQDLVGSADGKRAAVVLDARRALVFDLQ